MSHSSQPANSPEQAAAPNTSSLELRRAQLALDKYMLEEYKNISKAHFNLHNGLRQMFRFYLGVVAVPVTIFAFIYKDAPTTFESVPSILTFTLCLIGAIGLLMFLSLINMRFDIIFYTRTVNGTRSYIVERAKELKPNYYMLLPDSMEFPSYKEGPSKAYWWQFLMIALINSIYISIGIRTFNGWAVTGIVGLLTFLFHVGFYYFLAWRRKEDTKDMLKKIGRLS